MSQLQTVIKKLCEKRNKEKILCSIALAAYTRASDIRISKSEPSNDGLNENGT